MLGEGSRVQHPAFGEGAVVRLHAAAYEICFMQHGMKLVGKEYEKLEVLDRVPPKDGPVSFGDAEKSLARILRAWSDVSEVIPLGDRWKDGLMILQPGEEGLKSKEIPIDAFFHKIVMVRDRLRVMEQRINSSKLSDEEKVDLQQYITRIYGSLTTFNILFKNKDDYFVGVKS